MATDFPTGIQPIPPRYVGLDDAETFGRLSSRPDRIDPNAEDFFAAWIAGVPVASPIVSGDRQSGEVGTVLSAPLVVKVTDSQGSPVVGVPVAFRVRNAGARIDGRAIAVVLTTQEGKATASPMAARPDGGHPAGRRESRQCERNLLGGGDAGGVLGVAAVNACQAFGIAHQLIQVGPGPLRTLHASRSRHVR